MAPGLAYGLTRHAAQTFAQAVHRAALGHRAFAPAVIKPHQPGIKAFGGGDERADFRFDQFDPFGIGAGEIGREVAGAAPPEFR